MWINFISLIIIFWSLYVVINTLDVTTNPMSVNRDRNSQVTMRCIFSESALCWWTRNDHVVSISGRYWYQHGNANEKRDCSLVISGLHDIDIGDWYCTAGSSSDLSLHKSESAHLNIKGNTEEVSRPTAAIVVSPAANMVVKLSLGYFLSCRFDRPVACYWEHNGTFVGSNSRIKYAGPLSATMMDCSINILNLRPEDVGSWKCRSKSTDEFDGSDSAVAILSFTDDSALPMSIWLLVLIAFGGLLVITVIGVITFKCCKRKIRRSSSKDNDTEIHLNSKSSIEDNDYSEPHHHTEYDSDSSIKKV